MDRNIRARDRTVNQIKAIQIYSTTITNLTVLEAIQARERNLEKLYQEFNTQELELLVNDKYEPISPEIDEIYLDTIATLKAAISSRLQPNLETPKELNELNTTLGQFIGQQHTFLQGMHQAQNVRLPKINIEPFSGDYKLWPSFHGLYITSVHENTNLSAVHKLQILNGLLRGEAASLIRHIKVTEQNYEEAWSKLVARYNKPKAIISSLIQVFLEQRGCNQPNHKDLRRLCDTSDEVIRGLRVLGDQAETRDPWLIHILLSKLDEDSRQLWAKETVQKSFPTFNNFLEFLTTRCDALESCVTVTKPTGTTQRHVKAHHVTPSNKWSCIACKKDHYLFKCPIFKSMNVENRTKLIEDAKGCTNCLRSGHIQTQCLSRAFCLICNQRHHSLLHKEQQIINLHSTNGDSSIDNILSPSTINSTESSTSSAPTANNNSQSTLHQFTSHPSTSQQSTSSHQSTLPQSEQLLTSEQTNLFTTSLHETQTPQNIILPTALIYIQSSNGQQILARALLDSGSQASFITESCVQRLGLRRKHSNISIYGLASCTAGKTRGKTTLTIRSRVMQHYNVKVMAHIIEKISAPLPETTVSIPESNEIWQLYLADPQFNQPSTVDVLIGAEHFLEILSEQKKYIPGLPVLHASKFGWLMAGDISRRSDDPQLQSFTMNLETKVNNEDLIQLLKRFWQIEEITTNIKQIDRNDPCEILYRTTTTRSLDGRFIVKLPFIIPRPELGDSLINARSRMFGMEKKFARSVQFHKEYTDFIEEYVKLGQMEYIPWSEIPQANNAKYFMPHHAIQKESTTTKLRVVFDASCKTSTAVSLNECLHAGPKIQPDLTTTLMRFRQNIIAINADIEKMFRQILVDPIDANFQLILWRSNFEEKLKPFKCKTVTYGTTCAPFLAIRTLEELALIHETTYPEAATVIRQNFYMDDMLTGSDTVEGAIQLKNEINEIFHSCGFRLRKWKSNSQNFLQSVAQDNSEDVPKLIEDDPSSKTLGILWHPQKDIFMFKLNILSKETKWTKRKMLSESSKLYDPLGWISPVIICFKMFLQKLWLAKADWDEDAPISIVALWKRTYENLHHLEHVKIPRCLLQSAKPTTVQLHAFCDASESAYGCVIYIRSCNENGEIDCRIVCSKSKVAPIKQISLPRLELCGAVLLANLLKYCQTTLNLDNIKVYAWTDSMVVLHWLSDIPARWKSFIANRTSTILDIIPREKWNHVVSNQNPADFISRGVDPKLMQNLLTWWHGPSWLTLPEHKWPKSKTPPLAKSVDTEARNKAVIALTETDKIEMVDQLLTRVSSWFRLRKIMAYVLRYCRILKHEDIKPRGKDLAYWEYLSAEMFLIRDIQGRSFEREINKLKRKIPVETSSALSSLDPFIDHEGILRVGGRLKNANISYAVQHPIILPKNHPVNSLIIQEIHRCNLHAGINLMLSILRQKYWMIGARYLIKRYIKSCVICIRFRHTQRQQKMADLPIERCTRNRPFLNTGVDYLGPIYIKTSQQRNAPLTKAYVAVFICLAVKAVHLEVVSNLSTEAFLAALKRFVSRRGCPSQISCDNGSNFIGANNELKRLKKEIINQQNNEIISNFILQKNIEFKFNPASAPHFGGLWEAAVKSVKYHFRRTTKESKFNFEETTTLVTQIEGLLNSRPLCRLNDDSTSLEILTPGHFLIGESLMAVPEPILENVPLHKLSRWQNIQRRVESFWKSWTRDYLNTLQERGKWRKGHFTINIDDLVLVKDDNLPPSQWLLGRIVQTHPGSDGIIRVATIKTAFNSITRPVTKLILLPKIVT